MFEILIHIHDQRKAQLLTSFLQGLDFVESVQVQHTQQEIQPKTQWNSDDEFFAFAGIWADRETTLSSLRNEAWFQS